MSENSHSNDLVLDDEHPTPKLDVDTPSRDGEVATEPFEDLLIEEISIDGMCGVY